jgi:group II intron reverse transcriptase/maturase
MSLAKIGAIIDALRQERYRWTPVRRVYIEKAHSTKKRPLGVPTWSDKLLQEVLRLLLEAYYEPQFSPTSHGFRPHRGCHTALQEIYHTWVGTKWFIEGDIAQCFDALDHSVLLAILRENIHDNRFLRLLEHLLHAGYLEDWRYHTTLSGSPQGSGVSPLLANLYLTQLDRFVEQTLLPQYTQGHRRRPNPAWQRLQQRARWLRKQGHPEEARYIRYQMQQLPSLDPNDPGYRRLRYIRYADDWLLGFSGPRAEAEAIKQIIGRFLQDHLKLELSEAKTRITHARTHSARFLGYAIRVLHHDRKLDQRGHRSLNGQIGLTVPTDVVKAKCAHYRAHGQPRHRPELVHDSAYSIVAQYQQEYRGIVEYYRLAYNLHQLNRLKWVMERSLTQTLALKFKTSVRALYHRFQTTLVVDGRAYTVLQVIVDRGEGQKPLIARWGGISLRWKKQSSLNETPPRTYGSHTELEQRLRANQCEICGSRENIQVHHVRALKDLRIKGRKEKPFWKRVMAARKRKTLVVCRPCHHAIHAGRLSTPAAANGTTLESRVLRKA